MKTPKEVLQLWVNALNDHDAHGAAALYHDDATNIQVAAGSPVNGRQAIFEDFIHFFHAFPDGYTHIENLFEDGEWAIIEWTGGGTFLGEFAGMPRSGKKFTLRGCGFFHITAGKILFQRGYWDKATWFGQLGIEVN
jgi:steroid delta-isomerase-like uncharacterized protein